jgi:hypothetical protein
MSLLPLHGAAGAWDEVICLVVPATAILGVALAVLKQHPEDDADTEDATNDDDQAVPDGEGISPADAGRER